MKIEISIHYPDRVEREEIDPTEVKLVTVDVEKHINVGGFDGTLHGPRIEVRVHD
jgi:hypothetical protein